MSAKEVSAGRLGSLTELIEQLRQAAERAKEPAAKLQLGVELSRAKSELAKLMRDIGDKRQSS